MFSPVRIATTTATAVLLWAVPTLGFFAPQAPFASAPHARSLPRRGATTSPTMAYAPSTVQDAWDNHFAAFAAHDMDRILLDYDEDSVVTTYDQTADEISIFKGVEGARTLFEGLFEALSDQSDLAAPVIDVSEESNMVFLVWRCPASGFLDATDTFTHNDKTKKISRQNVAYKTG
ncbi:unnamed protein product [Ectocarpus sp. 6 AP-2014]